jgi:hypothetical protein
MWVPLARLEQMVQMAPVSESLAVLQMLLHLQRIIPLEYLSATDWFKLTPDICKCGLDHLGQMWATSQALQEQLDSKAIPVPLEHKGQLAQQEHKARRVPKARRVLMDNKDQQVPMDNKDQQEHKDQQVPKDQLVQMEHLDRLV